MLHCRKYIRDENSDWVVFIHGMGGSSAVWFKQIKDYKKHFNLLLIDLRGHGGSKDLNPLKKYTFDQIAEEVIETMDNEGIKEAFFVGMSLGTIVINAISNIAPERVKAMVLGGALTRFNFSKKILIKLSTILRPLLPYMALYKLCAMIIMPCKTHKEARKVFIREAKKLGHEEFLKWYNAIVGETEKVHNIAKRIKNKIPRLYIMGGEDYMFLKIVKQDLIYYVKAQLSIIENAGHVCNIDKPQEFNLMSIEFFKQCAENLFPQSCKAV